MTTRQSDDPRNPAGDGGARWYLDVDSPVGALRIVVDGQAVVGLYHGEHSPAPVPDVLGRPMSLLPDQPVDLSPGQQTPDTATTAGHDPDDEQFLPVAPQGVGPDAPSYASRRLVQRTARELREYFGGTRECFTVPVVLQGTPFQRSVWAALEDIPLGERRSYRDIAGQLGNASMGRAVGAAVRANPVSIIIPGHRIVARTGAVVGYAAGVSTKTALLDHEAACRPEVPWPLDGQTRREEALSIADHDADAGAPPE